MWRSVVDGLRLTFHLAGINNQNFLMRDEETGTYWQQISGRAVSGPLVGKTLTLQHSDELSFKLWKSEQPQGTLVRDVAAYTREYSPEDWDVQMAKARTVIQFRENGMEPRDIVMGVEAFGKARAYRYDALVHEKLVMDRIGVEPVMVALGSDGASVRIFRRKIAGIDPPTDFYRVENQAALFMDAATGSGWNFQGCAISGKLQGTCLEQVETVKDYWFDWRNYHKDTTIFKGSHE